MPPEVLPSTVDIVVKWAKANPRLSPLLGTNVSTTLPKRDADMTFPWLQISRLVGTTLFADMPIDRARMQFNVWGGVKSNGLPNWVGADQVARTLESEIREFEPVTIEGAVIEQMVTLEGTMQLVDPDNGSARFWMDAIVVVRNT